MENTKIFISYSWADRDMVWPLAEVLSAKGLEVWIDKREIRPGDRITEQVQKALVEFYSKKFFLLLVETFFYYVQTLKSGNLADAESNTRRP